MSFRAGSALVLAALGWCGDAFAHGPPPFIHGVAAARAEGPSVLIVTEGLVQQRTGLWHYVCPALFGTDPSPLALSGDGARTFVVGDRSLYALDADGAVTDLERPELTRGVVVALVVAGTRVFALRFSSGASDIVSIDGEAPLWSVPFIAGAVAADEGGFWVGTTMERTAAVHRIALDGTPLAVRELAIESGEAIAAVHGLDGGIYVWLVDLNRAGRLLWLGGSGEETTILETAESPRGLAQTDTSAIWAAAGGWLYSAHPAGASEHPTQDLITCVGATGPLAYACSGTKLLSLDPEGPGAMLADLADLQEPDLDRVEPGLQGHCLLEWQAFRGDLEAIGVLAPVPHAADAGPGADAGTDAGESLQLEMSGGCSIRARRLSSGRAFTGTLVAIALFFRRRRSCR